MQIHWFVNSNLPLLYFTGYVRNVENNWRAHSATATCSSCCTHHCCSCCCIYRCSCNCHTLYALHLYLAARCCTQRRCQLAVCDLRDIASCFCHSHTHTHIQFDSWMPTLYALLACSCCSCCCLTQRFKSAKLLAVFQLIQLALSAQQAKALKAIA